MRTASIRDADNSTQGAPLYLSLFYSHPVWIAISILVISWLAQRAIRLEYAKHRANNAAELTVVNNETTATEAQKVRTNMDGEYERAVRGLRINQAALIKLNRDLEFAPKAASLCFDKRELVRHIASQHATIDRIDAWRRQLDAPKEASHTVRA